MKIINPLSPNGTKEDIKTVLRVLAGQGGCDGEPYDQMQAAADYIAELEETVEKLKCCGNCKAFHHCQFRLSDADVIVRPPDNFDCDKWEAK